MNKRARKHHLRFCRFLQLIIDDYGKTETVVRQMDEGYTQGSGSVRPSAAYGVQPRRVAVLAEVISYQVFHWASSSQDISGVVASGAVFPPLRIR
ncbi:hypothetical protein T4C_2539 [Trichinella pseudospiralis]|uniref:Uncharacterized protein n=1 Tax=Trichinella pseudospiralis TaxID=6337 RepID=A0A0V1JPU4_TRIPS|nr:hypothetical protein T4C_2539 [Trichinella pseudospiralis]